MLISNNKQNKGEYYTTKTNTLKVLHNNQQIFLKLLLAGQAFQAILVNIFDVHQ